MASGMLMYQGEKQDSYVSINDKFTNLVNGVKGERSWFLPTAVTAMATSLAGLPLPYVIGASAINGLANQLFFGKWLRGKSVPAPANT